MKREFNPAVIPTVNPKPDQCGEYVWLSRHEEVSHWISRHKVDLVFLGDSIIHYFGGNPVARYVRGGSIWEKYYGHRNAVNMGFGWDQTQHLLWRLQSGNCDGICPAISVILIGINNLRSGQTTDQTLEGIKQVCNLVRLKWCDTKLFLLALLPFGEAIGEHRCKVKEINANLADWTRKLQINMVDFGENFLLKDGSISIDLMPDLLNPSEKGYQIFAESLELAFKQIK